MSFPQETNNIARMLNAIRSDTSESFGDFMTKLPSYIGMEAFQGLRLEGTAVTQCRLEDGNQSLYWDGTSVGVRTFNRGEMRTEVFRDSAQHILQLVDATKAYDAVVIDVGSSVGTQSFFLLEELNQRGLGNVKLINVEVHAESALIGAKTAERLDLNDRITTLIADLLADETHATIVELVGHHPIFINVGFSFPHYTDQESLEMYKFLITRLGTVGGVHRENVGYRTPTFKRIMDALPPGALRLTRSSLDNYNNPIRVLMTGDRGIEIIEYQEVAPFFLGKACPSLAVWRRAG